MTSFRIASLALIALLAGACGQALESQNVATTDPTGQGADPDGNNGDPAFQTEDEALEQLLVGTWNVTNLGRNETGVVTFNADGTYVIDSGEYEAGGSWMPEPPAGGTYSVHAGVIALTYDGWNTNLTAVSRFAQILRSSGTEITTTIYGHSHGLEVMRRDGPAPFVD